MRRTWPATRSSGPGPLVNIYNKRRGAEQSKELAYAGPVPAAPLKPITPNKVLRPWVFPCAIDCTCGVPPGSRFGAPTRRNR